MSRTTKILICSVCLITAIVLAFALFGGEGRGSQSATGFEGTYVASDNPDEWLTVKGNHWWQGNNNVMVDCTFTARKTSDTTYDVELTYQTVDGSDDYRGYKKTLTVRKDGDYVLVKDIKDETKFKIKAQIIHLDDHTWVMKMDEGMTNSSIR